MSKKQWSAVNRFSSNAILKGCWLVDPDGNKVATIMDGAIARQVAAAMNLTTAKQRHDYLAESAGYGQRAETNNA